jgi:hypothetical protein
VIYSSTSSPVIWNALPEVRTEMRLRRIGSALRREPEPPAHHYLLRCAIDGRTKLHLELAVEVGEYEFVVGAQVHFDQVIPWRDVPDAAGSRVPPAVARARQVTGLKSRARGYCSKVVLDGAFLGGGVAGVSVLMKTYASEAVEGVIREYMARCELNERGIESHVSNALFCRAIRVSRNINGRPALARALSRLSGSRGLEASRSPEVRAVLVTMM